MNANGRRKYSPPSVDFVLQLLVQLLLGVAEMQEHGLLHRDIKPGNVVIEDDGRGVRLMDFGIAAPLGCRTSGGTLEYMAPEVVDVKLARQLGNTPSNLPGQDIPYGYAADVW